MTTQDPAPVALMICSGVTAIWCPIHGDCTCAPDAIDPEWFPRSLHDDWCPLHSFESQHAQ